MELNFKTSIRLHNPSLYLVGALLISFLFSSWSAQGQQLEAYIQEAIKNNPTIQAVETQHAISTEKISESKSLPNTEFSAGYMLGEEMPMLWQGEFAVMQMLPWFGTLSAREKYATAMADADLLEIDIAKREIVRNLSQSYYRLVEIARKQKVLTANIELLEMYEQMALTSIEVGNASAVSLLRLQMRQNDLIERKLVLEQAYLAEQTTFNKIMNREEDVEVTILEDLEVPEADLELDNTRLNFHPEVARYEELNNIVTYADAVNKKERAPQIGIGMEYMYFTEGSDMLMPMVSVSIPIFNKKYKSVAKQNKLRHQEIDVQKQATQNTLIIELQNAIKSRDAARIRLKTQDENLEQAKNATEILFKNFETGTIDFREVLDVQELQLQFQINRIETISEYFKQTSIIDYFTAKEI